MKTKYFLLYFLIFLSLLGCRNQDPSSDQKESFVKYYGNYLTNQPIAIFRGSECYFVFGNSDSGNENQIMLVKIDEFGNSVWERNIVTSEELLLVDVIELKNNQGFALLCNNVPQTINGLKNRALLLINYEGTVQTEEMYSYSTDDEAACIAQSNNNLFLVANSNYPGQENSGHISFLMVNEAGDSVNYSTLDFPNANDLAFDIANTKGNTLLLAAKLYGYPVPNSNGNPMLIQLSNQGDLITQVDNIMSNIEITHLYANTDSSILVSGSLLKNNNPDKIYAAKLTYAEITGTFNFDWQNSLGNIDNLKGNYIFQNSKNQAIVIGTGIANGRIDKNAVLLTISEKGNLINEEQYGNTENESGVAAIESTDGQIILLTETFYQSYSMMGIIKQ